MKSMQSLAVILSVCLLAAGCAQNPTEPVSSENVPVIQSGIVSSGASSQEQQVQSEPKRDAQAQEDRSSSSSVSSEQNALLNAAKALEKGGSKNEAKRKVTLTLSTNEIPLGEILVLTLENVTDETISAQTSFGFTPKFFKNGDEYCALVPISYNLTPGAYTLTVQAGSKTFQENIEIQSRDFVIQHLTIDETVASTTNTAEANAEWERKIEPLKLVSDDAHYWEGKFLQPVQGTITTEYGSVRYTNGSQSSARHSGIDIAARQGTPVLAAGNGRVLFAGYLQLTGNTIVLEHGMGLKTFYYHMQKTDVQTGDEVKQGDVIGAVGSTGYSTGPHLHFAATVNQVFTNPWTLFASSIA